MVLGPLVYEFGWSMEDSALLGKGTIAGHLLECAGQVTGGYFCDPGRKDVPDLWDLGFPIAEVSEDGGLVITKLPDKGGLVSEQTCKEQIPVSYTHLVISSLKWLLIYSLTLPTTDCDSEVKFM